MMSTQARRAWFGSAVLVVAVYLGAYVVLRVNGAMVHYAGYMTGDDGLIVAEHRVTVGGLRDTAAPPKGQLPAILFTPLRWAETACWYIVEPPGSEWTRGRP